MNFWAIFYNLIFIPILYFTYKLLSIFNSKIKKRERDYPGLLNNIQKKEKGKIRILFHSSSLGEFEQAKPVIERLKRNQSNIEIIASFYSPSGLENSLNYKYVDHNVYMPFDSLTRARKFVNKINPDIIVFVRYDIWRNHIGLFKFKRKPLILINASKPSNFFKSLPFFKSFYRDLYSLFDEIYTLNRENYIYFDKLNIKTNLIDSADTRYDRIMEKVTENIDSDLLNPKHFQGKKVLVLGSSWEEDEELLSPIIKKYSDKFFTIIVPHEPTPSHIISTKLLFPNSILLSEYDKSLDLQFDSIIVDSIGKLLQIYSFADAAYIGGGISKSVHSVSEPAGYALPLACGPKIERSPEAKELNRLGSLFIVNNNSDVEAFLNTILNEVIAKDLGFISGDYIKNKIGSSNLITKKIISIANKKISITKK